MIVAQHISFSYDRHTVLDEVGLEAANGKVIGLIGPNGSGKSTFLRILYAALESRKGTVMIDDCAVSAIPSRELPKRMAVVAQETSPGLPVSVAEMVLLGRSPHRSAFAAYTAEDHQIASQSLSKVGMRELADRSFATLSGGEKQRTLIARAVAQKADHLLLDEPTNHLDIHYQHELLQLVKSLQITTIVVLHDLNLAARYCDRLVLLDHGKVACSGEVADVLDPDMIRKVYRMSARVFEEEGDIQLVFRPLG